MPLKTPNLLYISVVLIVLLCCCESMPPNHLYRNLIDGKGLYDENDKVVILNSTNFKSKIFGTNNAWVVEFYNSWCGHCFMFAPKWKALAADIYDWRKVVQLAALDCSTEENNPTCRDYDVMGYPTLKFFPAQAPPTAPGTEIQRDAIGMGSPPELERAIVGILRKEQVEGRGSHWPNITPLRSSDLSPVQSDAVRYVFFVFEDTDSSLGTELILDMSQVDGVEIRTVLSENEALARTLGVHRFPSIVHVPHGHAEPELLHPSEPTREGFRLAVRAFLSAKGVALPEEVPPALPSAVPAPDLGELMRLNHAKTQLKAIKEKGDVVFLADLETALRYMLQHEVPNRKVISGEALTALRKFLAVVAKYFPAGEAGIRFLQELRDSVQNGEEVRGLRFKALVKDTSGGLNSVLATQDGWVGCRGSEPHLRGFPCGVWTLFHFFTVSALRATDPMEVLGAMLGYITYFFGCSACSQHFQEMAARSMRAKATDTEQAALWLWSAHNEVNQRLAGAPTDDPEFPKVQYPSPQLCPKCRDTADRWSEPTVLSYLRNKYHQDSLNYQGANTRAQVASKLDPPPSNRRLVETVEEIQQPVAGRYFNSLDISICIALYVVSGVICAAVCWKFILRRHYRKKAF